MTSEKNEMIEQHDVNLTRIITKNGTIVFIQEDGTVTVKDDSGIVLYDSSNPNPPPPPPPGH